MTIRSEQLFHYWEELSLDEQTSLAYQIATLDTDLLRQQQQLIQAPPSSAVSRNLTPFTDYALAGSIDDATIGQQLINEGKVGCLLIAGGQGSRLGHDGPKGTFPISDSGKSLFALSAERVIRASEKSGRPLPLAIMTSPSHLEETQQFFDQHHRFGLSDDQLFFFCQGTLPLLDRDGHLFLETKSKIAMAPDGNGSSLTHFIQSGLAAQWSNQGIHYLNYILIDNPLADPYDAELIGFHHRQQLEVTIKCVIKEHAEEKVGTLINDQGRITVIEYSELPDEESNARNADGTLKHCCANISLFCFSMDFIHKLEQKNISIPLHKALKAAKYLSHFEGDAMAWKFEKFIFDLLPFATPSRVKALLYPRESCFAPLKNRFGIHSVDTVRAALRQAGIREYFGVRNYSTSLLANSVW